MSEIKINRDYTQAWVEKSIIYGAEKSIIYGAEKSIIYGFDNIGRVLTGDLVKINSTGQVELVEARRRPLVGCLKLSSNQTFTANKRGVPRYQFVPLSANYPSFLVASNLKRSQGDTYIIIEFQSWTGARPNGKIIQVLGPVGDLSIEILTRLHYRKIYFPKFKTPKSLNFNQINSQLSEALMNSGFPDRTDLEVYSIDPAGCIDIDDAFSAQFTNTPTSKSPNTVLVGVHIADVNFFLDTLGIDINQLIDRPTSVYLPDSVNHMLPEFLATNWASLRVGQIRPTVTIWWKIDIESGTILDESVERILIRNHQAFSYEEVNRDSNPTIHSIYQVTQKMAQRYLNPRVVDSQNLEWDSHSVIETLMILSNHRIAKLLGDHKSAIYRVHFDSSSETGSETGSETSSSSDVVCPAQLTKIVNQLKMESANYTRVSDRHYGLDLDTYTHFTSPIRRLVDVLVHRSLLNLPVMAPEIDLSTINQFNQRVKRFERDMAWLNLVETASNLELTRIAYILGYNSETCRIILYLELDNQIIEYRLIPEALAHLFEISFDNHELKLNSELNSELKSDQRSTEITLKLYQKISLKLYAHPKETSLQNKLGVEIEQLQEFLNFQLK